ncbi:MAG: signal peptidase I [Treponema sp.]|nr:signal peptidase I [Treponema sp.]
MNKRLFELSYTLRKEKQKKNTYLIVCFLMSIIIINVVMKLFFMPVRQVSDSMSPNFCENSLVMINLTNKNPQVGDAVLLKPQTEVQRKGIVKFASRICSFFTGQQKSLIEDKKFTGTYPSLRRVVGTPGDTIYMDKGIVYIKHKDNNYFFSEFELTKTTYDITTKDMPEGWENAIGISYSFDKMTLQDDEYFVLCDNRYATLDSRLYGTVKADDIKGCVFATYFPFSNLKLY